jgi:hypothetical protein
VLQALTNLGPAFGVGLYKFDYKISLFCLLCIHAQWFTRNNIHEHLDRRESLWRQWPILRTVITNLFSLGTTAHTWVCPPLYWGFLITYNQTNGRTLLDEWSPRCRGLYLHRTTHYINTRDKHPCPERDSKPRSQQPSGHRPRGHWDRHHY